MFFSEFARPPEWDVSTFLEKVVNRPNPVIRLGQLDFSCSFLICDATSPDLGIIYASQAFTRLTGYAQNDVYGQNCRFLQAPDGNVPLGSVRQYSDNNVISHMKFCIDVKQECQFSLINYRKNGTPFINLCTVIPVCYNDSNTVSHFIGFQIDLMEQPDAITEKLMDGTYYVNYQRKENPSHSLSLNEEEEILQKEVQALIKPDDGELSKDLTAPIFQSSYIENCTDFIHIISIRGLFLYVSPKSCKDLLGYSPEDMLGHNISEFVHPSDLVFVMRELRSSNVSEVINIICRMKQVSNQYIYMELRGHVYQGESGKRTRCIVMSGREKQAGKIQTKDILLPETCGPEAWAKISPEGLFLYNCPATPEVLGLTPEQCYARSLFDFVNSKDHLVLRDALKHCLKRSRFYDVSLISMHVPKGDIVVHIRLYNDCGSNARHLYCQIKLLVDPYGTAYSMETKTIEDLSGLYADGNIFDFMKDDGSTSLYFEMNQLRVHNKKLKEELESLQQDSLSSQKRKASRDRTGRSGSSTSSDSQRTAVDGTEVIDISTLAPANKNQRVP